MNPVFEDTGVADYRLARVMWRDSTDEPWRSITSHALKSARELRELVTGAIVAGKVKHNFYRLEAGELLHGEATPASTQVTEGITMNKTTKTTSTKADRNKAIATALQNAKAIPAKPAVAKTAMELVKEIKDVKAKTEKAVAETKAALKGPDPKAALKEAVSKAKKVAAEPKAEKKAKAEKREAKPRHQWYFVKGDSKKLSGPFKSIQAAWDASGVGKGTAKKIENGWYSFNKNKKDPKPSETFQFITDDNVKKGGFEVPATAAGK